MPEEARFEAQNLTENAEAQIMAVPAHWAPLAEPDQPCEITLFDGEAQTGELRSFKALTCSNILR